MKDWPLNEVPQNMRCTHCHDTGDAMYWDEGWCFRWGPCPYCRGAHGHSHPVQATGHLPELS